jgi:hypothetical protein
MTKSLANGQPVRKCAKAVKVSPALRAQQNALATAAAHKLNENVETVITTVNNLVDELAVKHGKPVEVVQELIHLSGHVLKSHHAAHFRVSQFPFS